MLQATTHRHCVIGCSFFSYSINFLNHIKIKIMYFYESKFYDQVEDIIDDLDLDDMEENETLSVENCTLEPIVTLSAKLIAENLENDLEDRHSENNADEELKKIIKVLESNIDFDKINSELPKLWYPNNTFETYSKEQLLSFLE